MRAQLMLTALLVMFSACKSAKTETVEKQPEVKKETTAPEYIISIEDKDGNILNTRYEDKLFEGTEKDFVQHELTNLKTNKVEIQTLESDDEEVEGSSDSFHVYWQQDSYFWQFGNVKFSYTKTQSYMADDSYDYNPYHRPVYVRSYRRHSQIW